MKRSERDKKNTHITHSTSIWGEWRYDILSLETVQMDTVCPTGVSIWQCPTTMAGRPAEEWCAVRSDQIRHFRRPGGSGERIYYSSVDSDRETEKETTPFFFLLNCTSKKMTRPSAQKGHRVSPSPRTGQVPVRCLDPNSTQPSRFDSFACIVDHTQGFFSRPSCP